MCKKIASVFRIPAPYERGTPVTPVLTTKRSPSPSLLLESHSDAHLHEYLTHKEHPPLGPRGRPVHRVLGGSLGVGRFLMGEVPLYAGFRGQAPRRRRSERLYRGTSLTRKRTLLGPYRRPTPQVLGGSQGGGRFPMGQVLLYAGLSGQAPRRSRSERLYTARCAKSERRYTVCSVRVNLD